MTTVAEQRNDTLPAYARHLWAFGFMNAVCYTIALGAPMVLCARFLGASESLIGFLLALTPLFTALQLPAARFADRWGYQKLMMAGWRTRAFIVLAMAPLPLLVRVLPPSLLLFLFTLGSVLFNAIRGFASGSWLPWVKHIIAAPLLGRYFSGESIAANIAALITLLLSGLALGHNPAGWQYAILLTLSGSAGVLSVLPLARAPAAAVASPDGEPEPLRTVARRVWSNKEYRRLVRFATANAFALGSISGFTVLFLKEIVHISEGRVVMLTSAGLLGAMCSAYFLGRHLDRVGSRPVMRVAGLGQVAFFGFFAVFCAVGPVPDFGALLLVLTLGGVINNASGIATGRLVVNTCPREDLTVAMAISQVAISVAGGIATVAWGFVLEWLRAAEWFGAASRWPFFIFYLAILLLVVACQFLLGRVHEPAALPTDRFVRALLIDWPQRAWDDIRDRD